MKEVDQTLQGLHNIYCRMDRMVENMPLKIEDYWAGDPYEIPEEPDGERTKKFNALPGNSLHYNIEDTLIVGSDGLSYDSVNARNSA